MEWSNSRTVLAGIGGETREGEAAEETRLDLPGTPHHVMISGIRQRWTVLDRKNKKGELGGGAAV